MEHFVLKLFLQVSRKSAGSQAPDSPTRSHQGANEQAQLWHCLCISTQERDSDSVYYLVQVSEKAWQET